ncbi:hypothetical protein BH20CHL7_BH20CHL7_04910 [soil metagenome]
MPTGTSEVPILAASSVPNVTAAQMTAVDRSAIEDFGVTLLQMMEQAGSHLAEVVRMEAGGDLRDQRVVVAVGPGDNGGGGLAAARHLANRGASVRVVLSRPALRMSEAGRHQLATLLAMGAHCCVATFDLADAELERVLGEAAIVVDAVLGYRALGAPRGEEERLIAFLTRADRPVVSLDLPSGLDPDDGSAPGSVVTAVATLTLALPKPGLFRGAGPVHAGRVYLGDLGLPMALYAGLDVPVGSPFAAGRPVLMDRTA